MEVKCYNKKCLNEWDYKGKSNDYITCPKCHYRIKLDKALTHYTNSISKIPLKSTHSLTHSQDYERVSFPNGFNCLVHKGIAKQLQEAPEEYDDVEEPGFEPGSQIKILSPSLPSNVQRAIYKKEQEQNNPFLNLPKEEPNFEVTLIPRDPAKLLEHQMEYSKWR